MKATDPPAALRIILTRLTLLLALAVALSGCLDEAIEQFKGDPEPGISTAEADLVVAEFDQAERRLALPNDVVLQSLIQAGQFSGDGVVRNMPIRIPFSGPIQYPFDGEHTPTPSEITAWGQSVFIFPADNPSGVIPALPSSASGNFKTVYLDDNDDLVLVPEDGTFANGQSSFADPLSPNPYVVVVTKGVKDAAGNPINEAFPTYLTKSTTPLVDGDNESVVSALTDEQAQSLEQLRQSLAPIYDGLAAGGLPREQIALLFTFSTETDNSIDPGTGTPALIAGMETAVTSEDQTAIDITWFTGNPSPPIDTDPVDAGNFKSQFTAQGIALGAVGAIYTGYYPCLNFLDDDGSGGFVLETPPSPGDNAACPNANGLPGQQEFWLSEPAIALQGIVVFQHGITRSKDDFIAVANALGQAGFAVIATDLWAHGSRTYQVDGETRQIIVPDEPDRTVGFLLQSRMDIIRTGLLASTAGTEIETILGGDTGPLHYVSQSLGSILGSLVGTSSAVTFDSMLLNVPGGDVTDIVIEGDVGTDLVFPGVAEATGFPVGSEDFNEVMLGLELANRHAVFAGLVDPLAVYDPTATTPVPDPVLMQQVVGDTVVPNNNNELLARVMALTTFRDGDGDQAAQTPNRVRWIFDPDNYTPATADHSFLLDGETTATAAAQGQMVQFITLGSYDDPSQ